MQHQQTEIPQMRRVIWYLPLIAQMPTLVLLVGTYISPFILIYNDKSKFEKFIRMDPANWVMDALVISFFVLPWLAGGAISYALLRYKLGLSHLEVKNVLLHTKYPDAWIRSEPCYRRNRPLLFNGACIKCMLPRIQNILGAIPFTLAITMVVAYWFVVDPFPKGPHPGSNLIVGVHVPLMLLAFVCGNYGGWILNVLYSRYILHWSWPEIRAIYGQSDVPLEWMNLEKLADPEAYEARRPVRDLEAMLSVGRRRYVATRGTLLSGLGLFIATYLPLSISFNAYLWKYAAACAIPCAIVGHFLGRFYWWLIQRRHRKLTTNREVD